MAIEFGYIGGHAFLGDLAMLGALWVFVELINPTATRIKRAKYILLAGTVFTWLAWAVGGFYYVNLYGPVRTAIKAGPWDWGHLVYMETKEHVFLFGPFLVTTLTTLIWTYGEKLADDKWVKISALTMAGFTVLGVLLMVGMGSIISASYRAAISAF